MSKHTVRRRLSKIHRDREWINITRSRYWREYPDHPPSRRLALFRAYYDPLGLVLK